MSSIPENNEKDSKKSDPDNPFQIALRTYLLSLTLSVGPSILPLIISQTSSRHRKQRRGQALAVLNRILKRELAFDGFAFSMTLAVAGGALLKRYWRAWAAWKGLLDELCFVADGSEPCSIVEDSQEDNDTSSQLATIKAWFAQRLGNITPEQETFISYVVSSSVAELLLQAGIRAMPLRPSSNPCPTLDLTLLLLVRAIDSVVQSCINQKSFAFPLSFSINKLDKGKAKERVTANDIQPLGDVDSKLERKQREETGRRLASRLDAVVFWACSARIMWCFVYEPQRLHKTYVTWIQKLANLDPRMVQTLRLVRTNEWTYKSGPSSHIPILEETCKDLGYPPSWGNPSVVPEYGGNSANETWKNLGVKGREGIGGVPCEVLHYLPSICGKPVEDSLAIGLKRSCTANAIMRMGKAFLESMAIYLPVHILPVLLTNPQTLLRPHRLLQALLGSMRSSTFLSSFIALFWFSVCFMRTIFFAKLLPFVSHNFWDGPLGGVMAACLMCGSSIWIENGRRRGEMALYVLPKALRTLFPNEWLRSGNRRVFRIIERLTFILSLATLLTAATHRPESLRGLSRWTLAFIMNGPNAGFWKRRRRDPSVPSTPSIPPTPVRQNGTTTVGGSQDVARKS